MVAEELRFDGQFNRGEVYKFIYIYSPVSCKSLTFRKFFEIYTGDDKAEFHRFPQIYVHRVEDKCMAVSDSTVA